MRDFRKRIYWMQVVITAAVLGLVLWTLTTTHRQQRSPPKAQESLLTAADRDEGVPFTWVSSN
eukprot:1353638-Rhodomonas_salina.1